MSKSQKPHQPEALSPLASLISERILQHGPLTVAEYMELALGHPKHGYYIAQNPFGAKGDFITAPEISQMFGEMIGAWVTDVWMQMGRPERIKLVELGPGKGTLMADIMRIISAWPDFKSAVEVHMVETSPVLRQWQEKALRHHNVSWHDSFSAVPEGPAIIVANEFFDALPVHQFEKTADGWQERRVNYNPDKKEFFFITAPLNFDITKMMPEDFLKAPAGSVFEISPVSLSILKEISDRIARQGGAALILDYGHATPGLGETVQAVSKHQYSSVLEKPGEKDITAHVDFGTFKTVAAPLVDVWGPVTQGQFLIAMGIEARAEKLSEQANDKQKADIMTALVRLVATQEMGRLFKVLSLTQKDAKIGPAGFGVQFDEAADD